MKSRDISVIHNLFEFKNEFFLFDKGAQSKEALIQIKVIKLSMYLLIV